MKLFNILSNAVSDGDTVIIVATRTGDSFTVSVSAKCGNVKDTAKDHIQPFVLKGTPAELDASFEDEILKPVTQSAGLQTSMKSYEAALAVAQANSKAKANEKKKAADEAKKVAAAQKKALDEAKALMDEKKWGEASRKYNAILADDGLKLSDTQKAAIRKNIDTCENNDGGLFGGEIEEPVDITVEGSTEEFTEEKFTDEENPKETNEE